MDLIDGNAIAGTLASSSTSYLVEFLPIFALIGGLVLAMGVIEWLVSMVSARNQVDEKRESDIL